MTNDRKNRRFIKALVIFSVILSVAMIACAYLKSEEIAPYDVAKRDVVNISTPEQLLELKEAIYNDECYLTADIRITDTETTIGTEEFPFEGVFDGNGHTIYLSYAAIDKNVSLFGKITKDAVVKNVNFVIEATTVSANAGLIARLNEGTITNCTINFPGLKISAPKAVVPLVSVNKGTISNIYSTGKFINGGISQEDERKASLASLCIYNWGIVKNSIVEVEYSGFMTTDKQAIFDGTSTNDCMAAISLSCAGQGVTENNRVIVSSKTYLIDNSIEFVGITDKNTVFEETTVFKTLDFDNRFWALTNGKLALILAEG